MLIISSWYNDQFLTISSWYIINMMVSLGKPFLVGITTLYLKPKSLYLFYPVTGRNEHACMLVIYLLVKLYELQERW